MENRNYYTIVLSLLGAAKLILNSFGIDIINDQMSNELANAIATILTITGVIFSHIKGRPDVKAWFVKLFKKKTPVSVDKPKQVETPVQNAPVLKENAPVITVAPSTKPIEKPVEQAPSNTTIQK